MLSPEDERMLLAAIAEGRALLVLGAGASATCRNRENSNVLQARGLAEKLALQAGLPYAKEELTEVLGAVLGRRISNEQFHNILEKEFTSIAPSPELEQLFDYTWRRVYTWNVDDAVDNVRGGMQRRRIYNGLRDKVHPSEGLEFLQTVYLHGQAKLPEHGFVFSRGEYSARLNRDAHDWYRAAAADYVSYLPIFIGSRLNEPILAAELDRARPSNETGFGRAFLVSPDDLSGVQIADFEARNICVLKFTLADFVTWLRSKVGKSITPIDVGKHTNAFTNSLSKRIEISRADVDVGGYIAIRNWSSAKADADKLDGAAKLLVARAFLEGMPPRWSFAASDIPVWLEGTTALYTALQEAIKRKDRLFLIHGQSGSGKTMALMQALLRYSMDNKDTVVYELRDNVPSLKDALNLIRRLHVDEHVVVYLGDAFIYGDALAEDASRFPAGSITLVSSARSGEWRDHIERRVGEFSTSFQYQRFLEADFGPLIQRLLAYVPAPRFKKASPEERLVRLRASKSQLLIALRETTGSSRFTEVITQEYHDLPDDDCRNLLLVVGVATIARTGVSRQIAKEAYDHLKRSRTFEEALRGLDGIVSESESGRLFARHESYVRHIVEHVASIERVIAAMVEILRTFTKFEVPIVKTVIRQDGLLFRFILNHNFLSAITRNRGGVSAGIGFYREFEVAFQLDGHYWLQYGQYLVQNGDLEPALSILNKSIQAYPDNPYAIHAYADLQLQVATRRTNFDSVTTELLDDAVKKLEAQFDSGSDQYPVVTLADKYVFALIQHQQVDQARTAARKYFAILEQMLRSTSADPVKRSRERLARFLTTGEWRAFDAVSSSEKKHTKRNFRRAGKEPSSRR